MTQKLTLDVSWDIKETNQQKRWQNMGILKCIYIYTQSLVGFMEYKRQNVDVMEWQDVDLIGTLDITGTLDF